MKFVPSHIAHLGPIRLPDVRHDRPQRPWWEAARLHSMRHYLGPEDRLLDIGAEMGDMSALFATWVEHIFLVEPNPASWPWISATFEENSLVRRVDGWFMGLLGGPDQGEGGRDDGVITYWDRDFPFFAWPEPAAGEPDPATGFHHLDEHGSVNDIRTVDEIMEASKFRPSAITCDIEGGEILMIEGMHDTLQAYRPKVWMSVHDEITRDRYSRDGWEVDEFFRDNDYDPIFLATDHERHMMYLPREMGWTY